MKLKRFEHLEAYRFMLAFENGEIKQADLQELIGAYVAPEELSTARINPEWECLEFSDGRVDIEPKTLIGMRPRLIPGRPHKSPPDGH